MLSDQTLADRGCEQTTASAMVAGFVGWLTGQRMPQPQRSRVYQEVERFLAWQHTQFPYDVSAQRRAVWCYLLRRQRDGESEAEVLKVWGALELLLTYVGSQRSLAPGARSERQN